MSISSVSWFAALAPGGACDLGDGDRPD